MNSNRVHSFKKALVATLGLALIAGLTVTEASAQTPQFTTPPNTSGSNSFPLNSTTNKIQLQYEAGEFGVAAPHIISRVYVQRSNNQVNPGSFTNLTIWMGQSSTWPTATNAFFTPVTQVYFAATTPIPPGSIDDWVGFQLDTPFLFDPADHLIVIICQEGYTNGISLRNVTVPTGPRRIWASGGCAAVTPTGSGAQLYNFGFDAVPAAGLHANFDADVKAGSAPLRVQFSDLTYSSDPGGVTGWSWDLTGDTVIDSTIQNPIWTYPTQGRTVSYDVTLTATDVAHPPSVMAKRGFITVDPPPTADFDATPTSGAVLPGGPPLIVNFTDLSIGATAWAWDLNGDTRIDSTTQNPVFPYITGGYYSVSLAVTGVGGNDSITKNNFIYVSDVFTAVVPDGTATTPGNSSTGWPWNYTNVNGIRIQYCYDTSNFPGITGPIMVRQLRWRANQGTSGWTGRTYDNVVIDISSAAFDHASLDTTFANNHGPDRTNVFTGTVTIDPVTANTTPGVWHVTVRLQTPFLYDPTAGDDLLVDITIPTSHVGGTSWSMDAQTTGSATSRVYRTAGATNPVGVFQANVGAVMEVGYLSAVGLYANFDADVTIGAAPLRVQFTDTTYTSDPGGVLTWAWDLTGDTVVDATTQNPTWNYPTQGRTVSYDVSLSVTDATHPPATEIKRGFITVDPPPVADFDATPTSGAVRPGGPPLMVQFTDLSIGATAWAWDLTGDTQVDSTVQNPLFPYTSGGNFSVTLSVTGVGGNDRITKTNFISVTDTPMLTTLFTGGNGLSGSSGCFFDIDVTNPAGIWITSFDVNCNATTPTPFDLEIYIAPRTYVGNETNAAAWTLVATGSGVSNTRDTPTPVETGDFFLPMGQYGMYVYNDGAGHSYTNGTGTGPGGNQFYQNADFSLTLGASQSSIFSSNPIDSRVWNGTIYYITPGWPKFGPYGEGCPGSNGVPMLSPAMGSIPQIGTTFTLNLSNMPTAGGSALALIGLSKTAFGPLPLPFDLAAFGASGCELQVDIVTYLGVTNVGGTGSLGLVIPNDPVLIGNYLTTQAFVVDPTANRLGLTVTNAGEMHIGN